MLARIRSLMVKELLAVLRDKRSRIALIGPPLVQLLLFSFAATLEVKNVALAVLDKDGGAYAAELVQRLDGAPTFTRLIHLPGEDALAHVIDRQRALAAVHIEADFSARIAAGRPAQVQLILDGRRSNAAQIVQGYLQRILADMSDELAAARGKAVQAITLERSWFNPNRIYLWYTVPSLVAILTMLTAFVVTALSVARERELGTFDQLLVSPLSPWEILLGKTLPAVLIGLAEGSFMLVMALTVFDIPFHGAVWLLYLGLLVFVFSVVGMGLFVSALAATQQQAILGAFLLLAPAIQLSGFATPIENMPEWLQSLTVANPLRHMLVIVRGVFMRAMPLEEVAHSLWPMIAIGVVTLAAAGWTFRRRLE